MIKRLLCLVLSLFIITAGVNAQENDLVYVNAVSWSSDGSRIATAGIRQPSTQGYLRIFDVQSGEVIYSLDSDPGGFTSVAWSDDNRFIAVGSYDTSIWIIDVEQQRVVTKLYGHSSTVTGVDWNTDGSQLVSSGNWDGLTLLWDMSMYTLSRTIDENPAFMTDVAFSPNDQQIAAASESGVQIYSLRESGEEGATTYFQDRSVASLVWSNDGDYVAFGTEGFASIINPNRITYADIFVFDADTGILTDHLMPETQTVFSLNWSADNRLLALSSIDGLVKVWDFEQSAFIQSYVGLTRYPAHLEFSQYGGRLAFGITSPGSAVTLNEFTPRHEKGITTFAEGGIQIVVPIASIERLNEIVALCNAPTIVEQAMPLDTRTETLNSFVASIQGLPEGTIPPACAADLIAVAEALR